MVAIRISTPKNENKNSIKELFKFFNWKNNILVVFLPNVSAKILIDVISPYVIPPIKYTIIVLLGVSSGLYYWGKSKYPLIKELIF